MVPLIVALVILAVLRIIVRTIRTMIGHMVDYSIRVAAALTGYVFAAMLAVAVGVVLIVHH